LAANAACNDLHLEVTTAQTRLALSTFTLSINGKMRSYSATLNTIPGTSSTSPSATNNWITSTTGKISVVGNTRSFTVSGEWGATNAGVASPNGFDLEINLNSGQTITMNTGFKARTFNVVVGTLNAGANRLAPDQGAASGSNFTIQSGATVISDQTGTGGSAVIGRTGSGIGGVLNLNSGATLRLNGLSPTLAMTTINFNGTVEYARAGAQTFAAATNSGANPNTYTNLTLSGSGIKTSVASLTTTVNGTMSLQGTATFANGTTATLAYGTGGTLEYKGSATQTAAAA
jgi:hypothetical protein